MMKLKRTDRSLTAFKRYLMSVILVAAGENVPAGICDERAGWSDWLSRV